MKSWTILPLLALAACHDVGEDEPSAGSGQSAPQPAMEFPAPSEDLPARMMAVADFNDDGRLDLALGYSVATSDVGTSVISVYLAQADGSFGTTPASETQMPPTASAMVARDFDGDEIVDLIVVSAPGWSFGSTDLLAGAGDGTFAAPVSLLDFSVARDIVAGDWDGDGLQDIALGGDYSVSILRNYGGADFGTTATLPFPAYMAAGDLDGDGKDELAVIRDFYSSEIEIYSGLDQGGSLAQSLALPEAHVGTVVRIADVDGDARPDVIAGTSDIWSSTTGSITRFYNQPAGWSAAAALYTDAPVYALAAGDVDGNGSSDLAWYEEGATFRVRVAWGLGDGSFDSAGPTATTSEAVRTMEIRDLDGDGRSEILLAAGSFRLQPGCGDPFAGLY